MADGLTLRELEDKYPDARRRGKLFGLLNISMILSDSIIRKDYGVPAAMTTTLQLTPYGQQIYDALRKRSVPFHEARLLCLLELQHSDIMIDVDRTDQDQIIKLIDKQVRDRTLEYPFVNGRLLYDRYFDLYGEESPRHLSSDETQRLLDGTPQGVAQYGRLIIGPYGILRSPSGRLLTSDRDIPLRHCADPSCAVVHRVFLTSSQDAPINKHREAITKLLEREEIQQTTAWTQFMNSVVAERVGAYADWAIEPVIMLIGDALDNDELGRLLAWLLENTDGKLREDVANTGALASGESTTSDLSRAQLLQLILLADNDSIVHGIDMLVRSRAITVPMAEIRQPVTNYAVRFGRHGLWGQLGAYGVRIDASGASLAPLRAKKLVEQMYRMEDEEDRQELDWQLRDEPSDSLDAKLENYLQTQPPKEAIGSLVLQRRNNVVVATTSLNLGDMSRDGDDVLTDAVLWKLGFSIRTRGEIHDDFWEAHASMLRQARQGVMTANTADRQDIRAAAGAYFPALERLLDDSLAFTIWALCSDHYTSPKPFVYRPHLDRLQSFNTLNAFGSPVSNSKRLAARNTLGPLIQGFGRLALFLEDCESRMDEFVRPPDEVPEWVDAQSLERFPFMHKIPFLDLLPDCRTNIRRTLNEIADRLVAGDTTGSRNYWLHGQRSGSAASLERLREGLDDAREAVLAVEENGYARQLYWQLSDTMDGDGRRTTTLTNSVGRKLQLFGPSPFSWLRMPAPREPQYVMHVARFAEPTECLRFSTEVESAYSKMWADFPRRPTVRRGRGNQITGPPVTSE